MLQLLGRLLEAHPEIFRTGMQAVTISGSRLGGAAATVLAVLILSRVLSPEEVGFILAAQAAAALGELGATLGRDGIAIQVLPQAAGSDSPRASAYLRSLVRQIALLSPIAALATGLALWLVTGSRTSFLPLLLAAATVPFGALLRGLARSAQALGLVGIGAFCALLLRPAGLTILLLALWAAGRLSLNAALAANLAAVLFALLILLVLAGRTFEVARTPPGAVDPRWRRAGLDLLLTMLLLGEFTGLVTLAGSVVLGEGDVATLGIALRYMSLVALTTSVFSLVFGPRLSAAYGAGRRMQVLRTGRSVTLLSAPATLVLAAGLWIAAPALLGLFGEAYRAGDWALRLLVLASLAAAAAGPNLLVLTAAGLTGEAARSAGLSGVLIAAGTAIGGTLGVTGAAAGAALGATAWQLDMARRVWRQARFALWIPAAFRSWRLRRSESGR